MMLFDESEFEIETPKFECKDGELWQLNNHRVMCGNGINKEHANLLLQGDKSNIIVSDPPYGVNYNPKQDFIPHRTYQLQNGVTRHYKPGELKHMNRGEVIIGDDSTDCLVALLNFNTPIIWCWYSIKNYVHLYNLMIENGYEFKTMIVWNKASATLNRAFYRHKYETLFLFVKKGSTMNFKKSTAQTTVWDMQRVTRMSNCGFMKNRGVEAHTGDVDAILEHGNQKPLEAMRRPIKNHTDEGDIVIDPFLGSGTTLIAAETVNRVCYGMEISADYCSFIIQRWINYMIKYDKPYTVTKLN